MTIKSVGILSLFFFSLSSSYALAAFPYQLIKTVGPGFVDIIPRQIVRGSDDRLYLFAAFPNQSGIRTYYSTQTGLLGANSSFTATTQSTGTDVPISVDTAYDGQDMIAVLANTTSGKVQLYPYSLSTKTFGATMTVTTASGNTPTDIGTQGVSSMFDRNGILHLAFWSNSNHITYQSYSYNSSTKSFTTLTAPTQVDTAGASNHPSLAISPTDGSVTISWVSQAASPATILLRTRSTSGVWSSISTVSTAPVWTSPNSGLNIDQGPSLVFDSLGKIHLVYMQDYENTGAAGYQYGRIHYVTNASGTMVDQALSTFTHDPVIAITSKNELLIIGHGHPVDPTCPSMDVMCLTTRTGTTWNSPQVLASPTGSDSYDASISVKWGVVGWNRPETYEFVFFNGIAGNYGNTALIYTAITPSTVTTTPTPVPTPVPTPYPTRCQADINQDHLIDITDYSLLVQNFFKPVPNPARADITQDGIVDISDYSALVASFFQPTADCGY